MRIDEINLLGQFKITGNTGNNSQAIGMSGGSTSFIDVVASGGGSSEGLVKTSGYNYIIVEATGNAIANGNKLRTAYNDVVTLLGQIGTPAADNRVGILLTPGDYDLNGLLEISVSYIDIVGISQNPLDTIVRASDDLTTFSFSNPELDFGLYNIDLRSGGTGQQVIFSDSGSGSTYLRMKNVIISGNGFWDGDSFFSFYDLDGEFEDITVLDGCYFALASNSITGTYKNIKIGDVAYAFYTPGTLSGTYKNIKISNLTSTGIRGDISIGGIFEDINIGCNTGTAYTFNGANSGLSGYFKNIIILGSHSSFLVTSGAITGTFEDIEISTTGNAFEGGSIDCTFKNIKIGDVTVSSVFISSGNVLGTYSNIEIGNVTSNVFYSSTGDILINIENIKIGNVGGNAFRSDSLNLTGTYKNITIGDVTSDCFVLSAAGANTTGTFDTIQVGSVGSSFFYSTDNLSGNFKNIKVSDATTAFASANLVGVYKNISLNSANDFFTGYIINGAFDDISVVNNINDSFYANGTLFGTFSNIKIDYTNRAFGSVDTLGGYYDGITIGTSVNSVFNSGASPVQGTFKNIKVTSCSGFFESGSTIQPTLVENIEVGECTTGNFIATAASSLEGTYKNVKVGSVAARSFRGGSGITGTYSNIEVGNSGAEVFYSGGTFDVNVDGAKLTSATDIFTIDGGGTIYGKINKLTAYGNDVFPGDDADGNVRIGTTYLAAKLTNSTIIKNGSVYAVNLSSGSSVERCKVITDTVIGTSIYGGGQVIYTMTNQTIDVTGVVSQNITDASITS